ncbi:hypothetical protein DVH24_000161, partial [Malus domestica]
KTLETIASEVDCDVSDKGIVATELSCADEGEVENPELCPKWIALLTMEKACLSTISLEETIGAVRKLGGNFKEKLRELVGLDAVFEVTMDCHSNMELKGNIRVFCRCRPLNQTAISSRSGFVVEFKSSLDNELQVICSNSSKKQFKFDHVFRLEDNEVFPIFWVKFYPMHLGFSLF